MNEVLPVAETMLRRHGEFYPFGGYMEADGKIVHLGAADDDTDRPKSKDLVFVREVHCRSWRGTRSASLRRWCSMSQLRCRTPITKSTQSRFVSTIWKVIRRRFSTPTRLRATRLSTGRHSPSEAGKRFLYEGSDLFSAIGVATILDASDFDMGAKVAEHDAVILGAEAVKRRGDVLQALDIAFLGIQESGQRVENLNGNVARDRSQVGLGAIREDHALSHF
jgi:hypothetical protein